MVKAWLNDDVSVPEWDRRPTAYDPVTVALDDDGCQPCLDRSTGNPPPVPGDGSDGQPTINPVLTLRIRIKQGYEDDGTPRLAWVDLVRGQAITFTQRTEWNQEAGTTKVVARATMLYEGERKVTETASATDDAGQMWRVTAVSQIPGSLTLALERIDQTPTGEKGS